MKLLFTGDFSIQGRANNYLKRTENLPKAFYDVKKLISECNYAITNLESPITNNGKPIMKDGPNLKNSLVAIDVLNYCGFNIVTLANNHLKDFGNEGVLDTIKVLQDNGVEYTGAGSNLQEARKPLLLNKGDKNVAIVNICENESSIASESESGSAPLDLVDLFYNILELKQQVDYIIVIIHGGCEHYQLPTPRMKKWYHYIADLGADFIVNHHQHCYSGYEIYNGVPIFYGIGNFYFDNLTKRNCEWNYGIMVKVDFSDKISFEIIPFEQCNEHPIIQLKNEDKFFSKIEELNALINNDSFLGEAFNQFIHNNLKPLSPFTIYKNHYIRALYHRGLLPDGLPKHKKVEILNSIRCESHREVLITLLQKIFKE